MTEREMMGLHAKVLALRDKLGISYKDACHRLYMTEYEKLIIDARVQKTFSNFKTRACRAVVDFQTRLGQLEGEVEVTPVADADAGVIND